MKHLWILLILALFLLGGCTTQTSLKLYTKTSLDCGFDTFCTLSAYTENEETFNQYYDLMVEEYQHYHKLFDIYHEYPDLHNLKTINDNAGIKPIDVEKPIIDMLNYAKSVNDITGGNFDITSGALLSVWHEYREAGQALNANNQLGNLPTLEELEAASKLSGYEHLLINEDNQTVYLDVKGMRIDVGAIGKGYATEMVALKLKEAGLEYGAVNGGGNQRLIGTKANDDLWNVGIANPMPSSVQNDSLVAIIKDLKDCAIVTSGDYQNYYLGPDNKSYAHIIDLKTLYPANYYHSVSIVTSDSGLADCLSTAIFALEYHEGQALIENLKNQYNLDIGVVYVSSQPLDETSVRALSQAELYVTYTDNLKDQITYQ